MKAHEMVNQQTLENRIFALAARLHVILRREKGRVIDIEYMRQDPAYCRHVLGLIDHTEPEEVRSLCSTLEELYFDGKGLFSRSELTPSGASPAAVPTPPAQLPRPPLETAASAARYIGRLR